MLRNLANRKSCYILAVLDCCREKLVELKPVVLDNPIIKAIGEPCRGSKPMPDKATEIASEGSIIIMYGCPPSGSTPVDSNMTVELFQTLW